MEKKDERVSKQTRVFKEKNAKKGNNINPSEPTFSIKLGSRIVTLKKTQLRFSFQAKKSDDHMQKKPTFKTESKWLEGSKAYHKFVLGLLESKTAILKRNKSPTESKEDEDCLQEVIYKKKKFIKQHKMTSDPTHQECTEEFEIKKIFNQTDVLKNSETIIQNHIDQIRSKVLLLDNVLKSPFSVEINSILGKPSSIKSFERIKDTDTVDKCTSEKINISETSNNSEKFLFENPGSYKRIEEDSRIYHGKTEECDSNFTLIQEKNESCIQSEGSLINPYKTRPGHYIQGDKPLRITKMNYEKEFSDLVFTIEWKKSQQDCELLPSRIRRLEIIKYDPLLLIYFYEKHLIFSKFPNFDSCCLKRISYRKNLDF